MSLSHWVTSIASVFDFSPLTYLRSIGFAFPLLTCVMFGRGKTWQRPRVKSKLSLPKSPQVNIDFEFGICKTTDGERHNEWILMVIMWLPGWRAAAVLLTWSCFQDNSAAVWPCCLVTFQHVHFNPLTWRNILLFQVVVSMKSAWVWWLTGLRDEPDVDEESVAPPGWQIGCVGYERRLIVTEGVITLVISGFFFLYMYYNRRSLSVHGLLKKSPP